MRTILVGGLVNSSFPSLRRRCCDSARVPAIRPCLARSLPHLHGHMLTLRLHVPIQVRCRSRKALKNGRDRGKTHLGNLVDSTPPAGDLSRSSGGHGHERPATPGRPTVDPLCILDPLPAHFCPCHVNLTACHSSWRPAAPDLASSSSTVGGTFESSLARCRRVPSCAQCP